MSGVSPKSSTLGLNTELKVDTTFGRQITVDEVRNIICSMADCDLKPKNI